MTIVVAGAACLALATPAGAGAANVVNGDFESGSLQGWHVYRSLEAGNWFAYSGTSEPIVDKRSPAPPAPQVDPPQEPPQGTHAAVADEINPDTLILYQDVFLPAGQRQDLSLIAYYNSSKPIAVPASGTLSVRSEELEGEANQQYRIDVMRPEAPIESIEPGDVLQTLFRTEPGDPKQMKPRSFSADLSTFAGQTVRLRFAVAAHEEVLTAGVDAVSITGPGSGGGGGGKGGKVSFGIGKLKLNRANGSAILPVKVPGPGTVQAKDAVAKRRPKRIKSVSAKAARAGVVNLRLRPTPKALATLRKSHKLRLKVAVTFTPRGERPETTTVPVTLRFAPRR